MRRGRLVALGVSVATTAVALLGGAGVLPSAAGERRAPGSGGVAEMVGEVVPGDVATFGPGTQPAASGPDVVDDALPTDSGDGRRVVFSEGRQRVWLVGSGGAVRRTYLVSGSLTDNLDLGSYQVYSRSEDAQGIDDSGTMRWFVRFAHGDTGAAIGFHTIPVDDGKRVQTSAQLGTPQSHGCIRQTTRDAKALWAFAPVGSTVVVVA